MFARNRTSLLRLLACAQVLAALALAAPAGAGPVLHPEGAKAAPALRADDLSAGLSGLGTKPGDRPFFSEDQFRYEYGDPRDDDCRRRRHGDDGECRRRPVPGVPEPSSYALMAAGLVFVLGLRTLHSRRARSAARGRAES